VSDWSEELSEWLKPFLARLGHKARRRMCPLYVAGLIGPGDRKSVGPMAERLAPDDYDQLHHFVSSGVWDAAPLEEELARQADALVGGPDAVLVIDDTSLPKKGQHSVGVAPQYASARQDVQLPIAGFGDPGLARGAGDDGSAALPARDLDG
jgi:SRSO17 transposase